MTNAHALRLQLLQADYLVIPLFGKEPPQYGKNNSKKGLSGWQKIESVTPEMLDMWVKTWPDATNTGALTRLMPTLDVDILDPAAAKAVEEFIRDRYEDAGYVLTRIGKPPKFAIPFRTEEPFKKIVVNLVAPDGSEGQKIEFLADGEQVVVAGIHPDTQQPYRWSNGGLEQVKHEDLPYTREDEAHALVDELVDTVLVPFGYKRAANRPKKGTNGARPHDGGGGGDRDWTTLIQNVLKGREMHDSITILAAKMITSGMISGAAINQLRALADASEAPKDVRWRMRVSEIPAAVDSAVAKYGKQPAPAPQPPSAKPAPGPSPPTAARSSSEPETEGAPKPEPQLQAQPQPQPQPQPPPTGPVPSATPSPAHASRSSSIADAYAVFRKWLILPSPIPFYAMVGTIAANRLPGDPVWLGLVAPPSSAKTEMLNSIKALPNVHDTGTLTEAALLSGVPKNQRATSASGGLLREVGAFGILLLKDFGSILSMHQENKAKLLAALREIFDGAWTRRFGTDGGKSAAWKGKLGLIFAVTGAIDQHRSIDDELGQRFLLCRLSPTRGQFRYALKHGGALAATMRKQLSDAVSKLFSTPLGQPQPLADNEINELESTINLVVRMRGATARDRFRRELEFVYGEEGTGRIGLCLTQLLAGLDSLGLDRPTAMKVVTSVAMDSVPPLRRQAYEWLCKRKTDFDAGRLKPVTVKDKNGNEKTTPAPLKATTPQIATALDYPTNTIRRVLEDLAVYHLIKRSKGQGSGGDKWHVPDAGAANHDADDDEGDGGED